MRYYNTPNRHVPEMCHNTTYNPLGSIHLDIFLPNHPLLRPIHCVNLTAQIHTLDTGNLYPREQRT